MIDIRPYFTKQFIRYLFVGSIYTIAGLFVFWLFVDTIHFKAVPVYLIWIPLSFAIRFLFDRKWVFNCGKE
jgi:putative flippase GtrA